MYNFTHSPPKTSEFYKLFQPLGIPLETTNLLYQQVAEAYSQNRFYHTLTHVNQVLTAIEFLVGSDKSHISSDSYPALMLAAWFHDIVYDPRRNDNEAQSVVWMMRELAPLKISKSLLQHSTKLIMATRKHFADPEDRLAPILLDADLSILGAPPDIYIQYARAIRKEYAFVPDDAYCTGRRKVLEQFIARPQIYITPKAAGLFERPARDNIQNEITSLSN